MLGPFLFIYFVLKISILFSKHFTDLCVIRRHRGLEDQRVQEFRIGE